METLIPDPPTAAAPSEREAAGPASHADASLALERVAAYCRAIGLRQNKHADDIAQRLVERVMAEHPDDDGRAWMRLSMDALFEEIDAWEQALSQHTGRERHLIAASLPMILRDQPGLFLKTDHLPEPGEVCRGVSDRPTPPLPPSARCKMPRQRFGKPPAVLRPGFWFRLWRSGQRDEHPIERMIQKKRFT